MGSTPSKYSRTGVQVLERMRNEGSIQGTGPLLRGNPNNLLVLGPDNQWYNIDYTIDMAHKIDAVTWWNSIGRFFGPKSPQVRQFMLDPNNYQLQPRSFNRSAGGSLNQIYEPPPESPSFDTPN
jgi:filamentous hemagglutinin